MTEPELVAPSLVVLTASKAAWIVITAVLGMLFSVYCGYRIGRLKGPATKPATKPKTWIKNHKFTEEQTLIIAQLKDKCDGEHQEPVVRLWQYIGTLLNPDDKWDSMELITKNHKQWWLEITKEVEEGQTKTEPPKGTLGVVVSATPTPAAPVTIAGEPAPAPVPPAAHTQPTKAP